MQAFQATWKADAAAAALAVAEKLKGRLEAHREKDKKDREKWAASLVKMAEKVGFLNISDTFLIPPWCHYLL